MGLIFNLNPKTGGIDDIYYLPNNTANYYFIKSGEESVDSPYMQRAIYRHKMTGKVRKIIQGTVVSDNNPVKRRKVYITFLTQSFAMLEKWDSPEAVLMSASPYASLGRQYARYMDYWAEWGGGALLSLDQSDQN